MKRLLLPVKIIVSLSLLGYLIYRIQWQEIADILRHADIAYFLVFIVTGFCLFIFSSLKWKILLGALHIQEKLWKLLSVYFVGTFFNYFLPSMIGGDVARIHLVGRDNKDYSKTAASILMERLLGVTALLIFAGIVLADEWINKQENILIALFLIVLVMYFVSA